jgi:hypothetical protein
VYVQEPVLFALAATWAGSPVADASVDRELIDKMEALFPQKRWYPATRLHGVIAQKTAICIFAAANNPVSVPGLASSAASECYTCGLYPAIELQPMSPLVSHALCASVTSPSRNGPGRLRALSRRV